MTTFALIHGGGHGGWCWELLIGELERRGFACVAPDLPVDDPAAGAREYADVVVAALDGSDDVIVVAHSAGGLAAPIVASLRPVEHLVFLGAMVPRPGERYAEYLAAESGVLTSAGALDFDDTGVRPPRPWVEAVDAYYHDVAEDLARRAWRRLRGQSVTPLNERCPLTAWPDVPSTYILMTEDRSVGQDWSRRIAGERLGVVPIELPGSHSPFLSRPSELADVLEPLARP